MLNVDLISMSVTNFRTLDDPSNPIYAGSQGNTQLLGGSTTGHFFMDYGSIAVVREYDSAGTIIVTAEFGPYNDVASYRGYKYDRHAIPFWDPAVAVDKSSDSIHVFMSWNGATDYDTWAIYGGPTEAQVNQTLLTTMERNGFETSATITSMSDINYIQAVARQGSNNLRASMAVPLSK